MCPGIGPFAPFVVLPVPHNRLSLPQLTSKAIDDSPNPPPPHVVGRHAYCTLVSCSNVSLPSHAAAHGARLSRLDTAADLGLETGLDGGDRPTRATALAGEEVQTVLLAEEGVGGLANLAGDVFDWALA